MITNYRELSRLHSDRSSRIVLAALEAAIESAMPARLVPRAVKFNRELSVRDVSGRMIRLTKFDHVYVVGAGKAAAGMTKALYPILQGRVSAGAITVPYGTKARIKRVSITQASHPIPDSLGVEGTKKILDVLHKASGNDLVFFMISGGGSALMPLPSPGVSLADKQKITNTLLRSGVSIHEMNAVRKHLSAAKGGQILRHIDNSCTVISLVLSDVVGDDLGVIASGPTFPDSSTFADALKILRKYSIKSPEPALAHIAKGVRGEIEETPKPDDPTFSRVHNVLIGNNSIACAGAVRYLKKRGVHATHLGSEFDREARNFGVFLARIAADLGGKSFALVAGGETTVRLCKTGNGVGGRNQEAALAYLIELKRRDVALACMGTDGIDGNSDAAGALVSPKAMSLAAKMDLKKYLDSHASYHAFKKLHSLIFTGYTGTNVNDIAILCGTTRNNEMNRVELLQLEGEIQRRVRAYLH